MRVRARVAMRVRRRVAVKRVRAASSNKALGRARVGSQAESWEMKGSEKMRQALPRRRRAALRVKSLGVARRGRRRGMRR